MGVLTCPALGFDPAPGDPAALRARAAEAGAAARTLGAAADSADRLDAGWAGAAADAFRARAAALPRDLHHAASAHATLARELEAYATGLAARRSRAAALEARAAALDRSRPDGAAAELAAVLAEARRLRAEHGSAAQAAAARIRAATDPPYRPPGLLARVRGTVERWVADHADQLTSISHGLRGVAGVLGTLSLVPGFQFLAPVAIAAGAAAVALDLAVLATTGRGSWRTLAADALLTALPTGPATRLVRSVPGVPAALRAANRTIPAAVRGRLFRTVRNLPEGVTADQLAAAAARIRAGAGGLTDDVVVQGSRAGHSARAGSDIDIGLRVPPDRYDELVRACFGEAPVGEARANAVARGRIFWRRAGLRDLHDGLQSDLDRKVDLAIIERGGLFDNEPWLRVR